MAAATPQGRWVFLVVLFCLPNIASAVTGWAGQRLTGSPYFGGWPVEDQRFLTYDEAVAWTLAHSPGPLMLYKEMTINGKRHVLFSQPSSYTPSVLDPNAGEPRYCENWPTGVPASRIAPSGHVMYGPDGTFPAHIVYFNNCLQPSNLFWRIVSAPVMDVHEVDIPLPGCPIPDLEDKPTDKCSVALEKNGNGLPDPASDCPATPVLDDPLGEPCLKQKLIDLGIPYTKPTATIRTAAYQAHLRDVWDRFWEHQWLITDPVAFEACAAKRAIVEAEMSKHAITDEPADNSSKHITGNAFDISMTFVNRIADVPALLRAAPACNLKWGGEFPEPDRVHFYTPPPAPAP